MSVTRRGTPRRPGTVRVARWSATHPWWAVTLWLVFVAGCLSIGQVVGTRAIDERTDGQGQSGQAERWLRDGHLQDPTTEEVLITARNGRLDGTAATSVAKEVTRRMTALPEVASVDAPVRSRDGSAVFVTVRMSGDPDTADARVAPLLAATTAVASAHPGLRIEEVGDASLGNGINDQVSTDLSAAASVSLPVTLLVLLLAFGAIIAAGVPVLLAMSAVMSATGLSALVSYVFPASGSTSSMILLMGMAVGVDYSLFYVRRVRAERENGRGNLDAIEIAAQTSGHSVLVSGVAVMVAMTGLFLSGDQVFDSLAAGSVTVVLVAVLGSLTVLPAVLVLLGRWIDRPRVPLLWRMARPDREPRVWSALLRPAVTRPALTLAVSVLALLALGLPALGMRLHADTAVSLPRTIPQVQTLDRFNAAFPGEQAGAVVVVRSSARTAPQVHAALTELLARVQAQPLFAGQAGDEPEVRVSADHTVSALELSVPHDAESAPAHQALTMLRSDLVPSLLGTVPGARWAVGGDIATGVDYDRHGAAQMPWVVGFVVIATMLVMAYVFRSVVLALVTAVVNLLSAAAAFGVLVLTFQYSWAAGLLDFHPTGAVINWIPLFTFAVLFGLSMDYHVFVVSRIREEAAAGLPTREAVRRGIIRSAGTVTSAALVMVSVFTVFASLHMVEMKELGVGLAVAVFLDALVVRAVVLPAAMSLLGRRVWWPGDPRASRTETLPAGEHPTGRDVRIPASV